MRHCPWGPVPTTWDTQFREVSQPPRLAFQGPFRLLSISSVHPALASLLVPFQVCVSVSELTGTAPSRETGSKLYRLPSPAFLDSPSSHTCRCFHDWELVLVKSVAYGMTPGRNLLGFEPWLKESREDLQGWGWLLAQ